MGLRSEEKMRAWRDENDEEKKVSGVCNKRERGYTCGERRSRREILD